MRVSVTDKLDVTSTKPVGEGYLAVRAQVARSGVYQYTRREIGMTDGNPNELVGVYRSPEFTFDDASLATIAHKPVTLNHPPKGVSAKSWKRDAVGHSGGAVSEADDRKHVIVDMLLMDHDGVQAAQSTHKQISLGYSTNIRIERGTSPEGEPYEAVMDGGYVCDHIALVPAGRAGHTCRIGDAAWPVEDTSPNPEKEKRNVKKLVFDGISVSIEDHDAVESGVKKLETNLADARTRAEKAEKALTDAEAKAATDLKDANDRADKAEAAEATAKKELADSKVTPEQLRDAAKAYAKIVDGATKIAADFKVEDSMTEAEIKKGAVLVALGDAYKDKSDAFFDAAFEIEVGKVKVDDSVDPFRKVMADRDPTATGDVAAKAAAARKAMIDGLTAPRSDAK